MSTESAKNVGADAGKADSGLPGGSSPTTVYLPDHDPPQSAFVVKPSLVREEIIKSLGVSLSVILSESVSESVSESAPTESGQKPGSLPIVDLKVAPRSKKSPFAPSPLAPDGQTVHPGRGTVDENQFVVELFIRALKCPNDFSHCKSIVDECAAFLTNPSNVKSSHSIFVVLVGFIQTLFPHLVPRRFYNAAVNELLTRLRESEECGGSAPTGDLAEKCAVLERTLDLTQNELEIEKKELVFSRATIAQLETRIIDLEEKCENLSENVAQEGAMNEQKRMNDLLKLKVREFEEKLKSEKDARKHAERKAREALPAEEREKLTREVEKERDAFWMPKVTNLHTIIESQNERLHALPQAPVAPTQQDQRIMLPRINLPKFSGAKSEDRLDNSCSFDQYLKENEKILAMYDKCPHSDEQKLLALEQQALTVNPAKDFYLSLPREKKIDFKTACATLIKQFPARLTDGDLNIYCATIGQYSYETCVEFANRAIRAWDSLQDRCPTKSYPPEERCYNIYTKSCNAFQRHVAEHVKIDHATNTVGETLEQLLVRAQQWDELHPPRNVKKAPNNQSQQPSSNAPNRPNAQRPATPPRACRHCGRMHWESECPNNPNPSSSAPPRPKPQPLMQQNTQPNAQYPRNNNTNNNNNNNYSNNNQQQPRNNNNSPSKPYQANNPWQQGNKPCGYCGGPHWGRYCPTPEAVEMRKLRQAAFPQYPPTSTAGPPRSQPQNSRPQQQQSRPRSAAQATLQHPQGPDAYVPDFARQLTSDFHSGVVHR